MVTLKFGTHSLISKLAALQALKQFYWSLLAAQ
jgi:hypothetical protein